VSLYPPDPEIGEIFNNRQWNGTAWVALNNPLSVEYTTGVEFTGHTSASANVHGILNSASLVYTNDSRLFDARTPVDESVTSAKIVDGTIVNEDINASAAIAPSKISGTAVVDNDARLTNERVPTNGSVTDAKIVSGGVSASVITGTAVVTNDARLSDQRTPLDNSVTSAKIVDGTIVNADISTSAAIAQSKISNLTTDLASKLDLAGGTMTGALLAAAGSASAPSISRGGDTDTGIFFPATNTVALTTNAVERMRITSGGDLGIGVNPAAPLHLYRATSDAGVYIQGLTATTTGTGKSWVQLDVNGHGGFSFMNDSSSGVRTLHINSNNGSPGSGANVVTISTDGLITGSGKSLGAWTTYTPALSQTVAVTTSTTEGRYVRIGTLVVVRVRLIVSSSGTAGGIISVSLPIAANPTYGIFGINGSGIIFQAATNTQHVVVPHLASTSVNFVSDISGGGNFGQQASYQVVSGDYVSFTAMYEVAP
jgi:hypothetical protein